MSAPRPRLAIIGISGYGRIHLELMREWSDRELVSIVAAVVINPVEEQANVADLERRGCKIYADYEQMLREHAGQIDLCMIPTGIHLHARMTIAALRAGANVLVEKPLAGSMAEVAAIRAAEQAAGRFAAVGFQDIYDPATDWLLTALRDGKIGEVREVRFLGIWPRPRAYFGRNNWAGRLIVNGAPVFDSPLNNAFGHFVLLGLVFAGVDENAGPLALDAVDLFRAHAIESFDTAVVSCHSPAGVRLWFGVTHCSSTTVHPEIIIEGTAGVARWSYEREISWTDAQGRCERRALPHQRETRRAMMAAVMRRLADPQAPICSSALAARHTAFIEAVHRAAEVRNFDPERIQWTGAPLDAAGVPSVAGIDAELQRAFSSGGKLQVQA